MRPHIIPQGPPTVSGDGPDFVLTLGGLLVEGQVKIETSIAHLRLIHTTLVPGLAIVDGTAPQTEPSLAIAGGIRKPPQQ